jgi:hypothetical protein
LVIDQWDRVVDFSHARVNLTAGYFHHIVLEYRELREQARVQLWWRSARTPLQVCFVLGLQMRSRNHKGQRPPWPLM